MFLCLSVSHVVAGNGVQRRQRQVMLPGGGWLEQENLTSSGLGLHRDRSWSQKILLIFPTFIFSLIWIPGYSAYYYYYYYQEQLCFVDLILDVKSQTFAQPLQVIIRRALNNHYNISRLSVFANLSMTSSQDVEQLMSYDESQTLKTKHC